MIAGLVLPQLVCFGARRDHDRHALDDRLLEQEAARDRLLLRPGLVNATAVVLISTTKSLPPLSRGSRASHPGPLYARASMSGHGGRADARSARSHWIFGARTLRFGATFF